ncbi:hypothetical protein NE865_05220 [Phthorimaea operculella]|nr:hypothetical protein NE865_05220 [Phthorimaea operculella]
MAKYSVGNLCTFNHENQDWSVHKDRLEQWFLANDFETDAGKVEIKKRAVLLSSLTETTFKLVRDLALPTKLNVLSYDEIVKLLDGHCVPAKCGFAERNRFYSSTQRPTEEFAEWAARVRGLAADCKFSLTGLNDLLRDRFVIGMQPGPERDNLFTQDLEKLTFSKALDTAQAIRSAKQGAAQSTAAAAAVVAPPVCKMAFGAARARHERAQRAASGASTSSSEPGRGQQAAPAGGACTVCGYTSHSADTCKFQRYRCKKCLNRGHLKRVCTENKVRQNFIEVEVDDFGDDADVTHHDHVPAIAARHAE